MPFMMKGETPLCFCSCEFSAKFLWRLQPLAEASLVTAFKRAAHMNATRLPTSWRLCCLKRYCTLLCVLELLAKWNQCPLMKYINAGFDVTFITKFISKVYIYDSNMTHCHPVFQNRPCRANVYIHTLGCLYTTTYIHIYVNVSVNLENCTHLKIYAEA